MAPLTFIGDQSTVMQLSRLIWATSAALLPHLAYAQEGPDAAAILGRDIPGPRIQNASPATVMPRTDGGPQVQNGGLAGQNGILVNRVNVDGVKQLDGTGFEAATSRYIGKTLSVDQLQQLAHAVADEARARGYIFASAMIPEQEIRMGVISVQLEEGRVDEVRVTGSDSRKLRRILAAIVGPAAIKSLIERQLLLAEDLPGITIAGTRFVREGGRGVLLVDIKEDRVSGSAKIDNFGSKSTGPIRLNLDFSLTSLITEGDELSVHGIATPVSPRELAYVAASYTVPVGDGGTRIGLAAAVGRTQPSDVPGHALVGRSRYIAVFGSYPIVRGNDASIWLNAEVAYLNVDSTVVGLLLQRDDLVTVNLSANGNMRLAGGRLSGGIGYVRGLGILGATTADDPFASRTDASGQFNKFTAWLNWTGSLGGDFSLRLAANGQIATAPLLSAQEIGLGGPGFGRAYEFSEHFGDRGIVGLIELRRDFSNPVRHIDWAQVYGFADGGIVSNLDSGFGGGALMSAGGGIRAGAGPFELGLEAAVPVFTPREEGGKSPRVNLSLGYN
ncbi:MAG: hypothetical protein RL367_1682, partial [Pseudomonadota bacterium]